MYSGVLFQCGFLFPFLPSCFCCDVQFRPGACLSRPGPVCGPARPLRPSAPGPVTTQPGLYLCRSVSVCPSITDAQKPFGGGGVVMYRTLLSCLFMVKAVIPCTNSLVILNQLLGVARQSLWSVAESLTLRPRPQSQV